jgi:hypothetical protein
MACSLWDSLQGFNGAHRAQLVRPYEPASHFPKSKIVDLRLGRPHGHREAPLLTTNPVRVAQTTLRCKLLRPTQIQGLQQEKDSIFKRLDSSAAACGKQRFLWEASPGSGGHMCRGIRPKSVIPFTKYCIASATSSRPMIRTRMRMPVSPRNWRTRAAAPSTR